MTTIAYKDGVLASDSRLSDDEGHIWTDKCKKIWRLKDGWLVGFSGEDEAGTLILNALRKGAPMPQLHDMVELTGVLISPEGKPHITEGHVWRAWGEPFVTIGSGKAYALAVMRAGGSAVDAVKAGIKSSCFSGGRVQTLRIKGRNGRS